MTDDAFNAWLKATTATRMIILEVFVNVGGIEITRYLSTHSYNTSASDVPANTHYDPILALSGMRYTEQISPTSEASLSMGDIEIYNNGGMRDAWLNDVWVNRQAQAFIGDPKWVRSDFRMIYNGIIEDIALKSRDVLALKLRDKLQRLNTPISSAILGGTTANKDQALPYCFGEVHNMTPLLIDPAALRYQVHNGESQYIIEVRDNGVPVAHTDMVVNSTFVLNAPPVGQITASVQGDNLANVYFNTVSSLIQRLATKRGQMDTRFTLNDLDGANLAAFEAAHPDPVGIYLDSRTNILTICQMLASSIGAQIIMSRLGLLQLIQFTIPGIGTPTVVLARHMVEKSLSQVSRTEVVGSVKIGYNKNWTVQTGLLTAITADQKDLFTKEWLMSTVNNAAVETQYRLKGVTVQQDTMLIRQVEADVEVARRLALWQVPRTEYQFEGTSEMLSLTLGQAVTVFNKRYGMVNGVTGIVTSLAPDWMNGHITVKFMI
jgi:hypothetical protein